MPDTFNFVRGQVVNVAIYPGSNFFTGSLPGGLGFSSVLINSSYLSTMSGTLNAPAGTYTTSLAIFIITDPNPLDPPVISCAEAILSNGVNVATLGAGTINLQFSSTNSGSSWQASLPSGCSINSFGHVSGTLSPGSYSLVIQCQNYAWSQNDYTHGQTQIATYSLTLVVVPALPVVSVSTNYGNQFGGNYTVGDSMPNNTIFAVQDHARPVVWSATGLPDGVDINPTSGFVTGKLTQAGEFNITISATNTTGVGTFEQRLIVQANQNVPVVTLSDQQPGYATQTINGQQQQLKFNAGDAVKIFLNATNDPASWTAADLPLGLAIDQATGLISGLIRVPGSYRFFVTATNDVGPSDALGVTVTATGSAQAFQFVTDDPTLSDVQIDIRSGVAVFGRKTPFKVGELARFALIWLDFGAPVAPPVASTVNMGFRPKDEFAADYVLPSASLALVEETENHPAYLLTEFPISGDGLAMEIKRAIAEKKLPLEMMTDVTWTADGIQRASGTFAFSVQPAVTSY